MLHAHATYLKKEKAQHLQSHYIGTQCHTNAMQKSNLICRYFAIFSQILEIKFYCLKQDQEFSTNISRNDFLDIKNIGLDTSFAFLALIARKLWHFLALSRIGGGHFGFL